MDSDDNERLFFVVMAGGLLLYIQKILHFISCLESYEPKDNNLEKKRHAAETKVNRLADSRPETFFFSPHARHRRPVLRPAGCLILYDIILYRLGCVSSYSQSFLSITLDDNSRLTFFLNFSTF